MNFSFSYPIIQNPNPKPPKTINHQMDRATWLLETVEYNKHNLYGQFAF
jgi:hypothetical protein